MGWLEAKRSEVWRSDAKVMKKLDLTVNTTESIAAYAYSTSTRAHFYSKYGGGRC
jgi:hypothetical protein